MTDTWPYYIKFHLWNSCLLLTNCCSGKKDSCLSNVMEWFPALFITCKLMTEAVDFLSLHGFFSFFESSWVFSLSLCFLPVSFSLRGFFPFLFLPVFFSLHGFFPFLYVFCCGAVTLHIMWATSFFFKSRSFGFLQLAQVQTEVSVTREFWLDVFFDQHILQICVHTHTCIYIFSLKVSYFVYSVLYIFLSFVIPINLWLLISEYIV